MQAECQQVGGQVNEGLHKYEATWGYAVKQAGWISAGFYFSNDISGDRFHCGPRRRDRTLGNSACGRRSRSSEKCRMGRYSDIPPIASTHIIDSLDWDAGAGTQTMSAYTGDPNADFCYQWTTTGRLTAQFKLNTDNSCSSTQTNP